MKHKTAKVKSSDSQLDKLKADNQIIGLIKNNTVLSSPIILTKLNYDSKRKIQREENAI